MTDNTYSTLCIQHDCAYVVCMYNVYFLFNGTHELSLYMGELENIAYSSWQEVIPPMEAVEKNTYDRKTRVKLNSSRECVNEYTVDDH